MSQAGQTRYFAQSPTRARSARRGKEKRAGVALRAKNRVCPAWLIKRLSCRLAQKLKFICETVSKSLYSRPPPVYLDLSTHHVGLLKKLLLIWQSGWRKISKSISGNLLGLLGVQNSNIRAAGRHYKLGLHYVCEAGWIFVECNNYIITGKEHSTFQMLDYCLSNWCQL